MGKPRGWSKVNELVRAGSRKFILARPRVSPQKEFLGCRAGAATESRPYRAFNVAGVANFAMMDYKHAAPLGQGGMGGPRGCFFGCD